MRKYDYAKMYDKVRHLRGDNETREMAILLSNEWNYSQVVQYFEEKDARTDRIVFSNLDWHPSSPQAQIKNVSEEIPHKNSKIKAGPVEKEPAKDIETI